MSLIEVKYQFVTRFLLTYQCLLLELPNRLRKVQQRFLEGCSLFVDVPLLELLHRQIVFKLWFDCLCDDLMQENVDILIFVDSSVLDKRQFEKFYKKVQFFYLLLAFFDCCILFSKGIDCLLILLKFFKFLFVEWLFFLVDYLFSGLQVHACWNPSLCTKFIIFCSLHKNIKILGMLNRF